MIDVNFRHSPKVGEFLVAFFSELDRQKVCYCVLHSYESLPYYAPSDVDIAVDSVDLERAERIVFDTAGAAGFRVIQKLHYDIARCYFYVISFRDADGKPGFVQIDILNDHLGIGRYLIKTETLLSKRRPFNGFWIPAIPVEASYLLIKKVIKARILPEHERKLHQLLNQDPEGVREAFATAFGANCLPFIFELIGGSNSLRQEHLIRKLRLALFLRYSISQPSRVLMKCVWLAKRVSERLFNPTGLTVCLVSPDGGGKSTIADMISTRLRYGFRNLTRVHWRPYLLPPPHKLLSPRTWNLPEPPNYEPHKVPSSSKLNSIMRFFYYALDYLFGYFPKILWRKIRTHLVVIERYYFDFLIDRKRYRLDIPNALAWLVMRLVPYPDLTFLLSGPPELILTRKHEISLEEIQRQMKAINKLVNKIPNAHIIKVDQTVEEEVTQIEEIILETLQTRLLKRIGRV